MCWVGCSCTFAEGLLRLIGVIPPLLPAENNIIIIEWIGIILALVFGVTMFCQGHAIFHGKYGYKHTEREKKMSDAREQVENLFKDK